MAYNNRVLLIILSLILILPLVSAADFDAFTSFSGAKTCSCGVFEYKIYITNNDFLGSSFNIEADSDIEDWIVYAPSLVFIAPGETEAVTAYVNLPCGQDGVEEVRNIIYSGDDIQVIENEITYGSCANVNIIAQDFAQEIVKCSPASFEFKVTNTGLFVETYYYGIEGFDGIATLNKNPSILLPKESDTIYLNLEEVCESQELEFFAKASRNKITGSVPLYIDVLEIALFNSTFPDTVQSCLDARAQYTLQVNNLADFEETYKLKSDKSFITFSEAEFTLAPGETGLVTVFIDMPGTTPTQKDFNIWVNSENSGRQILSSTAVAQDCGLLAVDIPKNISVLACGTETYPITVNNHGETSSILFTLDAPEWVTLEGAENLQLAFGEEMSVDIVISPPCDESGEFDISIDASHQVSGRTITEYAAFDVMNKSSYFELVYLTQETFVNDYEDEAIMIDVKNNGHKNTSYNFTLEGPDWLSLITENLQIAPGETSSIFLNISPSENVSEDVYNFTISAREMRSGSEYKALYKVRVGAEDYTLLLIILISIPILLILILLLLFLWINYKKKRKTGEKKEKKEKKKKVVAEKPKRVKEKIMKEKTQRPSLFAVQKDWLTPFKAISTLSLFSVMIVILLIIFLYQYYLVYFFVILAYFILLIIIWIALLIKFRPKKKKPKIARKKTKKKSSLFWKKVFTRRFFEVLGALIVLALIIFAMIFFYQYIIVYAVFLIIAVILLFVLALLIYLRRKPISPSIPRPRAREKTAKKTTKKVSRSRQRKIKKDFAWLWLLILLVILAIALIGFGIYYTGTGSQPADPNGTQNITDNMTGNVSYNQTASPPTSATIQYPDSNQTDVNQTETNQTEGPEEPTEQPEEQPEEEPEDAQSIERQRILGLVEILEEENRTDSFTYQILVENTSLKIDLTKYFIDPDNETLTFSASETSNMTIDIEDGIADITPEQGFIGVQFTTFTATDSSNESVSSPRVTIIVRPLRDNETLEDFTDEEEPVFDTIGESKIASFVTTYMFYIIAGFIILIILIAIMNHYEKSSRKKKK